jgi:hypothetical protein
MHLVIVAVFAAYVFAAYPAAQSRDQSGPPVLFEDFGACPLWWIVLSSATASLRSRLDAAWMRSINKLSGAVIFAFGIHAFSTAFLTR